MGLALAALLTTPALAAETVDVELVGERGGDMSMRLSRDSVPVGEVTFQVTDAAQDTPHEMIVVRLDEAGQELQPDPATEKVDEAAIQDLGEVEGLKAGQSGELTLTLESGPYLLICNLKGHYAAGMEIPFTVTEAQG